jgi:2-enoate reductase
MSKFKPDAYVTWTPLLPENIENPFSKALGSETHEETLAADLVVIATGLKADNALYDACVREHAAPELRNLGDSFNPGRVFEAVKAGYAVGRTLGSNRG